MKPNKRDAQEYQDISLISGHEALLKKRFVQLCDSLTSVKTDIEELKESLEFTQNDRNHGFSSLNEKIQSLEK